MKKAFLVVTVAALLSTGFNLAQAAPFKEAKADITGPGIEGWAIFTQLEDKTVRVHVHVKGDPETLTLGFHGIHVHAVGACTPTVDAAGGHFAPGPNGNTDTVKNHPYHLGDLPNLIVNKNGFGHLDAITSRITLTAGDISVFDDDGSAIIIHEQTDQRKCNPDASGVCTGVSGGPRIACGVITPRNE